MAVIYTGLDNWTGLLDWTTGLDSMDWTTGLDSMDWISLQTKKFAIKSCMLQFTHEQADRLRIDELLPSLSETDKIELWVRPGGPELGLLS